MRSPADSAHPAGLHLPQATRGRRSPRAPKRVDGELRIGGQEHFYLEGQVALAMPGEDGDMMVYSSTQHPTEVQHSIAKMLDVPDAPVTVECGAWAARFGGKEKPGGAMGGARGARRARDRPAVQDAGSTATTT